MRVLLPLVGLLMASPVFAGAPVEQDGPLAPCQGANSAVAQPAAPWGVEIAASFSKQEALDQFASAKQTYDDVLADYEPIVLEQCDLHMGTDIRYSVRIGMDSRDDADQLCAKLREAGGACIVQKN